MQVKDLKVTKQATEGWRLNYLNTAFPEFESMIKLPHEGERGKREKQGPWKANTYAF